MAKVKAAEGVSPESKHPESVTLESAYSFYDEDGAHHYWAEGHVVTDAGHIDALVKRGAPLKASV